MKLFPKNNQVILSPKDRLWFYHRMGNLIEAGIPSYMAIKSMVARNKMRKKTYFYLFLQETLQQLNQGRALSEAVASYVPAIERRVLVNAEQGGGQSRGWQIAATIVENQRPHGWLSRRKIRKWINDFRRANLYADRLDYEILCGEHEGGREALNNLRTRQAVEGQCKNLMVAMYEGGIEMAEILQPYTSKEEFETLASSKLGQREKLETALLLAQAKPRERQILGDILTEKQNLQGRKYNWRGRRIVKKLLVKMEKIKQGQSDPYVGSASIGRIINGLRKAALANACQEAKPVETTKTKVARI